MVTKDAFIGFDFSTQQLKSVVINKKREIIYDAVVEFDSDLPEFRTQKGVVHSGKNTVNAPVLMWVKALDMVLERLRICGADFSKVAALSGCAQQHGTVYWAVGAQDVLNCLTYSHFLHTQLASCFSINNSPVWLDTSTKIQCEALEKGVGGSLELAKVTGSRAYERFSAAQISKICRLKPTAYKNTERISLVSSFACSLFLGRYAPIDYADGSGMNLLDITTRTWSSKCMEFTAPDLGDKLGEPVPTATCLGNISNYFCERFGFSEECKIFAFTGDNPSSLAGMSISGNDIGISLGTSDTLFVTLYRPVLLSEGHLLISPISCEKFMALICYKNGSLSRERISQIYTGGNWTEFNKLLESTPRGNFGYIGLYYDVEEIVPNLEGIYRYDRADNSIEKFPSAEIEIRALIEGQFLAKRAIIEDLNMNIGESTKVIVSGGASVNETILQVISDIFAAPVYKLRYAHSAAFGAAYRAASCLENLVENLEEEEYDANLLFVCKPFEDCKQIYDPMVARFRQIIQNLHLKRNQ
ncbi:xylulose kinase-like isoform X2 [Rhodnius prolixus]|uniref:xylulose kinase-like isoform X2 n=1 Tax=Rhodnius prolixus TaxID=13249 RepID=UPI003D187B9E